MKRICILLLLFFTLNVHANDTLTRAQVYNFNVGDTFDYLNYSSVSWQGVSNSTTTSTSYSRYVIANIYYSLDSSIKYIVRVNVFPLSNSLDTLVIQNLSEYEISWDSTMYYGYHSTITIDSASRFNGRILDSFYVLDGPECQEVVSVNDIGMVYYDYYLGPCGMCPEIIYNSTTLIYYDKGSEIWGTPYYYFPTRVDTLDSSHGNFILLPTINNGAFSVNIADVGLLPVTLMVNDMSGKKTDEIKLTNLSNNINIGSHSPGVYIWKALSNGQLIQTGKLVMY